VDLSSGYAVHTNPHLEQFGALKHRMPEYKKNPAEATTAKADFGLAGNRSSRYSGRLSAIQGAKKIDFTRQAQELLRPVVLLISCPVFAGIRFRGFKV